MPQQLAAVVEGDGGSEKVEADDGSTAAAEGAGRVAAAAAAEMVTSRDRFSHLRCTGTKEEDPTASPALLVPFRVLLLGKSGARGDTAMLQPTEIS